MRRAQDVDLINQPGINFCDGKFHLSATGKKRKKNFALSGCQLLGIVETVKFAWQTGFRPVRRKDGCRRHHRPGQRPTTGFIHTRDPRQPAPPQRALEFKTVIEHCPGHCLGSEPNASGSVVSLFFESREDGEGCEGNIFLRLFAIFTQEKSVFIRVHPWLNFHMKIESLHIGMKVRHPQYGTGTVKTISDITAEIQFDNGDKRAVAPEPSGLEPAEPQMSASGLNLPLKQFVEETVAAALDKLGLGKPDAVVEKLGARWHGGKLVLHASDPALQTKEVPLETFFHKIVMVRNNLRVLEQKINAHEKLTDGEKVEMQQYLTRSYGSLTTFNVLFKEKEDQF
jgi:hypothetical protein